MTSPELVGVTGSTGRVGGRVAELLARNGAPMRLVVRDLSRAPRHPGAQVRQAAYDEHEAALDALSGVTTLFMVSAAESSNRVEQHKGFVDAAVEAGVQRIVYTSFFGAAPDATFTLARDHWVTEQHLEASGLAWTFLRDNLYLDLLPLIGGSEGVIRGPAGDGRVAAVSVDDVAAVATAVLGNVDAHAGQAYDLTGPEALTLAEAAEIVTTMTGRQLRYVDETVEEAYASRASYGAAGWEVDAWVSTYTAVAAGELDGVTEDVERLTGRPPKSLAELLSR